MQQADHEDLIEALRGLLDGETDLIANSANTAALLFERLPAVNWAGFHSSQFGTLWPALCSMLSRRTL